MVIFMVVILAAGTWLPVYAQSTYEYFDQTGHNLKGEFLKFYRSYPDAELIFGYPITEEFTSKDTKTVQYFQRARFELDPAKPAGQQVHLTPLGRSLLVTGDQINAYNQMACRQYTETGFPVCFAFLDFFDKHGGVPVFGYPISAFIYQDGMIVQYFENARLEWKPNQPIEQRVGITDLGTRYFDALGEDVAYKNRVEPLDNSISYQVRSLQVRAFVWKAVTQPNDQQQVYVIVQDQTQQPVRDARIEVRILWSDNQVQELPIQTTNEKGVVILPLEVKGQPYGTLVTVAVRATLSVGDPDKPLEALTLTSFRIWY